MNFNMIFIEDSLEFLLLLYSMYIVYMFGASDKTSTFVPWYSEGDNAFYEILQIFKVKTIIDWRRILFSEWYIFSCKDCWLDIRWKLL